MRSPSLAWLDFAARGPPAATSVGGHAPACVCYATLGDWGRRPLPTADCRLPTGGRVRVAIVTTNGIDPAYKNWPEYILGRFLVARGHAVTIYKYEPAGSPPRETIDGIAVRQIERGGLLSRAVVRQLRGEPSPDVAHLWHIRNLIAYDAARHFRRRGVPLVHTPMGALHDDYLVGDRDAPLDAPLRYDNPIF